MSSVFAALDCNKTSIKPGGGPHLRCPSAANPSQDIRCPDMLHLWGLLQKQVSMMSMRHSPQVASAVGPTIRQSGRPSCRSTDCRSCCPDAVRPASPRYSFLTQAAASVLTENLRVQRGKRRPRSKVLTHHGLCEVLMYACKPLHPLIMDSNPRHSQALRWLADSSRLCSTVPRKAGLV